MTDALPTSRKITLTETAEVIVPFEPAAGAPPPRRYGLLIFCQGDAQLKLLDDGESLVIGRKEPSEIVVNDPAVSRQHARFVRHGDEVWVEDLDSRHGTYLGARKIKREPLGPFDEVAVGDVRVVLAATRASSTHEPDLGAIGDSEVVVESPCMKRLYEDVTRAARGRLPVLVIGETGTGKEHVVRAIHRASDRRDKPLVAVNCAAIAPSLMESALFGHERGAFTGAHQRSQGVFERAHGGVLFLDEIGDLAAGAQVALLRALETQKFSRVGSASELSVDVHFVAATHCDLEAMVEEGTFRRDLYFRLNGIRLELPPLRERAEEIGPLARLFLVKACREWNLPRREFSPDALQCLSRCSWPGNVRQLRYAVERAALLATGAVITPSDLPEYVASKTKEAKASAPALQFESELGLRQQLKRYERLLIEEALRCAGGNRQAAAKLLRIPQRTFFRKLRAHGGASVGPEEEA